ncbi:MAG: hypothetical protein ACI4QC_03185 [Thermoguttaceae bacterium]
MTASRRRLESGREFDCDTIRSQTLRLDEPNVGHGVKSTRFELDDACIAPTRELKF